MKRSMLLLGTASLLLARPALAAAPTCPTPDFAKQAQDLIKPYLEAESFSGSILVAKEGIPVWRESFGAADREWDVANTADTKFRLGSITKQFTATAYSRSATCGPARSSAWRRRSAKEPRWWRPSTPIWPNR